VMMMGNLLLLFAAASFTLTLTLVYMEDTRKPWQETQRGTVFCHKNNDNLFMTKLITATSTVPNSHVDKTR
jgi:hypothetical protein